MAQRELKSPPRGWRSQTIVEIVRAKNIRVGNKQVTEQLAVDEGTIALIFSGDLQNKLELQSTRKTTTALLEQALKKNINEIRKSVFVPDNSVLVALARDTAGTVGLHRQGDAVINGAIASFTPPAETILPELLFYFFKNPYIRSRMKNEFMPGGKTYIRKDDIQTLRIKYPPEREQQERMVRQIETLLSQAESARDVLRINQQTMDALLESFVRDVFTRERKDAWKLRRLAELVEVHHTTQNLRGEHERYPFVDANDIDGTIAQIQISASTVGSPPPAGVRGFLLDRHAEVLLYASAFTPDTRWRSRVAMPYYKDAPSTEKLRCKDDLFALTVTDPTHLTPRFLFWALQDAETTPLSTKNGQFKGTLRIAPEKVRSLELRVPDPNEQERICAYLDACQEQLDQMKQNHRASQNAVDQLEGSILNQVFWEE